MTDKKPKIVEITEEHLFAYILSKIRARNNPDDVIPNPKAKWKAFKEVKLPKEGGIYTYYWGDEYPQKGFPFSETVEKVNEVKKMAMALLFGFNGFKGKWVLGIFYILFRKRILVSLSEMAVQMSRMLANHKLKPVRYCFSAQEVYRSTTIPGNTVRNDVRDVVCMVLEFDDAYRYRFQYTIGQISKDMFRRNPLTELHRVLDLMIEAELDARLRRMWVMFKKILRISFLSKDFRDEITQIINSLDLKKIKLDKADRHYAKEHHNLFTK